MDKMQTLKQISIRSCPPPSTPIPYQQPVELTHFSFNSSRQIVLNDSELNYYFPPTLESDLKEGFPENYIKREKKNESLDPLLTSLKSISYDPPDVITCIFYLVY